MCGAASASQQAQGSGGGGRLEGGEGLTRGGANAAGGGGSGGGGDGGGGGAPVASDILPQSVHALMHVAVMPHAQQSAPPREEPRFSSLYSSRSLG